MERICEDEEDEDAETTTQHDLPATIDSTLGSQTGLRVMLQANPNSICMAKADSVRKVSVSYLLQQRMRIPIFQRRYCWSEEHWRTMLEDSHALATKVKQSHSLGRLTCAVGDCDDGRILVVDGQQRNTTCALLLAAIRDVAAGRCSAEGEQLAGRLDTALFPDEQGLNDWLDRVLAGGDAVTIAEGEVIASAALVPTYCDRAAYFAATLPPRAAAVGGSWQRPSEAKSFFLARLQDESLERLSELADAVLHKFEWLFFPVDTSKNEADGTENLQVIFERLAVREATLRNMMVDVREAANMGAVDFVRNLLLSQFQVEADAIQAYKQYWLPIELGAEAAVVCEVGRKSSPMDLLERMVVTFLDKQPESVQPVPAEFLHVPVGGRLYPRFRRWLVAAMAVEDGYHPAPSVEALNDVCEETENASGLKSQDNATVVEMKTIAILRRLSEFASEYFANAQGPADASAPERSCTSGSGHSHTAKRDSFDGWRCTHCFFKNIATAERCATCDRVAPTPLMA